MNLHKQKLFLYKFEIEFIQILLLSMVFINNKIIDSAPTEAFFLLGKIIWFSILHNIYLLLSEIILVIVVN